jgi:hypothetical protein
MPGCPAAGGDRETICARRFATVRYEIESWIGRLHHAPECRKDEGESEMREKKRKPYEKPAVVFEKDLEALAADCSGTWLGTGQCKAEGACQTPFS